MNIYIDGKPVTSVPYYYPLSPARGVCSPDAHLSEAFKRFAGDPAWGYEAKFNDHRAMIYISPVVSHRGHLFFSDNGILIFNRHGEQLTYGPDKIPDIYKWLENYQSITVEQDKAFCPTIFDGLLMLERTDIFKGIYFITDCLMMRGMPMFTLALWQRKNVLKQMLPVTFAIEDAPRPQPVQLMPLLPCGNVEQVQSYWSALKQFNKERGGSPAFEGIIFKQVDSKYDINFKEKITYSWRKFRFVN